MARAGPNDAQDGEHPRNNSRHEHRSKKNGPTRDYDGLDL